MGYGPGLPAVEFQLQGDTVKHIVL
ncbi:hypothetical protein A2U01_0104621, partial [Trifolium medium]|nr:hypothetical protein [Trifolium medium]